MLTVNEYARGHDPFCESCGASLALNNGAVSVQDGEDATSMRCYCNACAQRLALGLVSVLTGSAFGIPTTRPARALMEAQDAIAHAAHELLDVIGATNDPHPSAPANAAIATVREYLTAPLARWQRATEMFLSSAGMPTAHGVTLTHGDNLRCPDVISGRALHCPGHRIAR